MKTISFITIIIIMSLFFLLGCKENGGNVDNIVPVYLEDFTEYTPAKAYLLEEVKGYVEKYDTELAALVKYDIKVYKVKYKTAFEGDSIFASGLLVVPIPNKKSDAFPMLSYQHGTMTVQNEAPTSNPQIETTAMAINIASTGFVVMIPDYIGFGSSSELFHPFMNKQYAVNAVLDFIRASKEFISTEKPCKINDKLFLSGYSEGGSATLAALSAIENDTRNNDLSVTASACGAGIYNLNSFRSWLVTQPKYDQPYLIGYLLESFSHYSNLDISYDSVYSEQFASLIPGMVDGVRTIDELNAMFGTLHVGDLFNDNFEKPDTIFKYNETFTSLRAAFTENSVPTWNLNSQVTLYYGKGDMWVPNDQSLKLYSEFRAQFSTLNIKIDAIDGLDHNGAVIPTLVRSVNWFKKF